MKKKNKGLFFFLSCCTFQNKEYRLALKRFIISALLCVLLTPCLYSQNRETVEFWDRWSLKTNALEWLITVPNVGVECDLVRTEFKKMSLSLTAKYNWNTYHKLAPATVFDMFDVRPEFRYYFRTENLKVSKPWWAMYVGPYLSYGTYTFKLSEKGIHGYSAGVGASAGYVIPMYEYKKGAIDVELGFSLGVQVATRDVFTHNPEGHYYVKQEAQSKDLHFTPFPVVSEMRVAFVWRKESIRHQVKIDHEKQRREQEYRKHLSLMQEDIIANLPESLVEEYPDAEALEKELLDRKTYLTGESAIRNPIYAFTPADVRRLEKKVEARCRQLRLKLPVKKERRSGK